MNILSTLFNVVFATVPTVVKEYDAVARTTVDVVRQKPWFLSRGMLSSVALVLLGVYGVFTGGTIDFADVSSIATNLESILVIFGGTSAAIGRAGVVSK